MLFRLFLSVEFRYLMFFADWIVRLPQAANNCSTDLRSLDPNEAGGDSIIRRKSMQPATAGID